MKLEHCGICKGPLDDPADPIGSADCGGDCRRCMGNCGDPDAFDVLIEHGVADQRGVPYTEEDKG